MSDIEFHDIIIIGAGPTGLGKINNNSKSHLEFSDVMKFTLSQVRPLDYTSTKKMTGC